jgi:hypothetical protein
VVGNAIADIEKDGEKDHVLRIVLALEADHQIVRVEGLIDDLSNEKAGSQKPQDQTLRRNRR